jgi:serine/threonine-protein kinase
MSFTPDGKSLVVGETRQTRDLMLLTMGTHMTRPLVESPSHEMVGELSPDGRWLAYESNEDGQFQIYVRPFPNVTGGRWQVSQGGGMKPAWDRSGRELFYLDDEGRLTSVPVQTNGTFSTGTAKLLLETRYFSAVQFRSYDVSPDGRRFLMLKDVSSDASVGPRLEILVTLNWFEELKTKVPVN